MRVLYCVLGHVYFLTYTHVFKDIFIQDTSVCERETEQGKIWMTGSCIFNMLVPSMMDQLMKTAHTKATPNYSNDQKNKQNTKL